MVRPIVVGTSRELESLIAAVYYAYTMSEVVHTRLDRKLLAKVDDMIERGLFPNRSGLVREATREIVSKTIAHSLNEKMVAVAEACAALIGSSKELGVAKVLLYGSVARNESREDSDIDLLILVGEGYDLHDIRERVLDVTSPVSTATGTAVTPLVMRAGEFERFLSEGYSFPRSVVAEGIVLYSADSAK